jgi:integrase
VLGWDQLWSILAKSPRRDRLLLALDMTEALRPSELFALRWRSFDDSNTLSISETGGGNLGPMVRPLGV